MKRLILLCLLLALLPSSGCRQSLAAGWSSADGGTGDRTKGARSLHLGLSDPKRVMGFLEGSTVALTDGQEDCPALAEYSQTLGELVKKYQRKANKQKSARCKSSGSGLWSCEVTFVHNDRRQSENDFALVLRFEVEDATGTVLSLACFQAG
jgi:hypothetical protein